MTTNYQKWVAVEHTRLDYHAIRNDESRPMAERLMAGIALVELNRKSRELHKLFARGSRR